MIIGHEMAKYREDIVRHISELVRIRSVREEGKPGMPFGEGVNRALEYMLALADSMGFRTANIDGFAGHAEYGEGDRLTAVLVHLDTVHEGEGWTYPPFGGEIHEERIIGRGASDNKGPAVVALYCLKAIRDLGIPPRGRIRIIFGTNEESGMGDMDHYFSKEPLPDRAFVPDAGYPMFNVEMGNANVIISYTLDKDRREPDRIRVERLEGGVPMILVPELCKIRMASELLTDSDWAGLASRKPYLKAEPVCDGSIEITAFGKAVEPPVNAVADMVNWLVNLPYKTDAEPLVLYLHEKLGFETSGESLGIRTSDELSGSTVVFLKQLLTEGDTVSAVLNVRYPVTADGDRLLGIIEEEAVRRGLKMGIPRHLRPVYVSPDDPVIRILSQAYERITGEKAELLKMGAGTYARKLSNRGVAFGAGLPGGVDTQVHRPDEFVRIDDMIRHAEICLQGLVELATEETESDPSR